MVKIQQLCNLWAASNALMENKHKILKAPSAHGAAEGSEHQPAASALNLLLMVAGKCRIEPWGRRAVGHTDGRAAPQRL